MTDAPVLICFDGSTQARRAITAAATILGPRRAVVLDVAPVLTPVESMAVASSVLAVPEFEDMNKTEALERARAGAELARKAGFAAEARTEVDTSTWDGIEAVADEIDAPVIVIGSRGLSGPRELFEGSVSRDVIRHSHRAVLVIPPPERPRRSAGG